MSFQDKTRDELILELLELQKKIDSLESPGKRDVTKQVIGHPGIPLGEDLNCSILHASPDNITITDLQGHMRAVSPAALKMFGYDHEREMIGKLVSDTIIPEQLERASSKLALILQGVKPGYGEYRGLRKDGTTFDIEVNGDFIPDDKGNPARMIFIVRDITGRKRMEERLVQTRQNYETFFNTIDEFLFVLDEQGNIIHTNSTVINRLGYTAAELAGMPVLMVHPPERRDEAGRIVMEMLQGLAEYCPVPLMTKSGSQIPVETRVNAGFWDGKPVIFGVTKDISAIRFSEEKFSKVFFLNPSACGLSDLVDHTYVEVNEAFYTLFGFEKDEVLGKTALELGIFTAETRDAVLSKADCKGNVSNIETELFAKNGDIKYVLLSSDNIYVQDKKYRFTVVQDITERKFAENALRESELRYKTLFRTSPSGIMVLDNEGTILEANGTISKTTLYPIDELEGDNVMKLAVPSRRHLVAENIRQILAGQILEQEIANQRKDGTLCELILRETAITLPNGKRGILSVSNDITERKRADDALKESETRFKRLFERHNAIMLQIDPGSGAIVDANDAAAAFYGYDKNTLRTMNINGINSLPDGEILTNRHNAIEDHRNCVIYSHRLASGEIRTVEVHSSPIDFQEKKILFSIIHDITERKQSEREIQKKNEELVKLNTEKDKFFSIIAHDLRSPFNSFLGLTQIIAEELPDLTMDEIHNFAVSMRNSAVNLYRLLENLLEWSMLQRGITRFSPEPFLLLPRVTEFLVHSADPARTKEIEITYDIPEEMEVIADVHMIETVIRNLVSNAVKFTPRGGKVVLRAKFLPGNSVEVSVNDTGIGMSKEMIDKLFRLDVQPFRKGTEGEGSTGLGLIICMDFIAKHQEKIWVESEETKGSTFFFSLAGGHKN